MRSDAEIRTKVRDVLASSTSEFIDRLEIANAVSGVAPLLEAERFDALITELANEMHGLGPLEQLLSDESITDVLVTGSRGTWIERNGCLERIDIDMTAAEVMHLVERIVSPLGLRVDRASPMVDARLADGSRVNVVLPPLAVDGPCISIRRFSARSIELEQTTTPQIARLLRQAVEARMNIVVVGGTGSGKTTLLNAMCACINSRERIVTVEDAAELRLPVEHVVRLEARPNNSEGVGKVTMRDLVRNALRMRPDRIIVGEVRGPEALDMLQAMNTGHEGSMSTCHASGAEEALWRIETMVMMGEIGLSASAIRRQICSAVDLVVRIARHTDGTREVVEVAEVVESSTSLETRQIANNHKVVRAPDRSARVAS